MQIIMKSWFIAVLMAALAGAVIQQEEPPAHTSSISMAGTHTEHTTAEDGAFVHPFDQVGPEV